MTHLNKAFVGRAIDRVQKMSIHNKFAIVLTQYLLNCGVMAYCPRSDLLWVRHPEKGWQVAVWMMPLMTET